MHFSRDWQKVSVLVGLFFAGALPLFPFACVLCLCVVETSFPNVTMCPNSLFFFTCACIWHVFLNLCYALYAFVFTFTIIWYIALYCAFPATYSELDKWPCYIILVKWSCFKGIFRGLFGAYIHILKPRLLTSVWHLFNECVSLYVCRLKLFIWCIRIHD